MYQFLEGVPGLYVIGSSQKLISGCELGEIHLDAAFSYFPRGDALCAFGNHDVSGNAWLFSSENLACPLEPSCSDYLSDVKVLVLCPVAFSAVKLSDLR